MSALPLSIHPDIQEFRSHYNKLPTHGTQGPNISDYLDQPHFRFQPRVMIVDVIKPDEVRVRYFGSALSEMMGKDFTGTRDYAFHSAQSRKVTMHLQWEAACRRCGFIANRHVIAANGMQYEGQVIMLPLNVRAPAIRALLHFAPIPTIDTKNAVRDRDAIVQATEFVAWVDVGSGVPEPERLRA